MLCMMRKRSDELTKIGHMFSTIIYFFKNKTIKINTVKTGIDTVGKEAYLTII